MDNDTKRRKKVLHYLLSLILEFLPTLIVLTIASVTLQTAIAHDYVPHATSDGEHLRHISNYIALTCKYILMLCLSAYLDFCRLHRIQITYIYVHYLLSLISRFYGLHDAIYPLLWTMSILGFALLFYIFTKLIRRTYDRHNNAVRKRDSRVARKWNFITGNIKKNRN